jgi:formamidopyrimidine-DNA glycosylase
VDLMPELPDLEIFKTNIFNRLTSKRLVGLEIFNMNKVITAKETLIDGLAGRDLLLINRVGKELFFDFGDNRIITAHLMLNGKISIVAEEEVQAIRFKIFSMRFERETIVFSDMGSLCAIKYMPLPSKTPDAFDATFTLEYFLKTARGKPRVNIKAFLIDQNVVKGIGNAYADEILWDARISPRSVVGKIPEEKLEVLFYAINSVLNDAIDSIKRISPDIISGEERSFLKVHNKTIKETATGYPIIIEKIASKTTYYTKEQVVYL